MSSTKSFKEISQNPVGFYEGAGKDEADRLQEMALYFDDASFSEIDRIAGHIGLSDQRDQILVLDIGAGNSPSLGLRLESESISYVPVDMRADAVESQKNAGFNAVRSLATCLELPDDVSPNVFHSRYTWGWLDRDNREAAFVEMLRTGKEKMGICVLDYDWSVTSGPDVLMEAVALVQETLSEAGFNPVYGAEVAEDMADIAGDLLNAGTYRIQVSRYEGYRGDIVGAEAMIASTANGLVDQLKSLGLAEKADQILQKFGKVIEYLAVNPDAQIALPDTVATTIDVPDKSEAMDNDQARSRIKSGMQEAEWRSSLHESTFTNNGESRAVGILGEFNVFVTRRRLDEELTDGCRRVQALAYLDSGVVGIEAISSDGTLVEENDPMNLVNRSIYAGHLNKEGHLRGVVRIINTEQDDAMTLPTVQRMKSECPQTWSAFKNHPLFDANKKVVEVSGLAKEMMYGTFDDVALAVLALAELTLEDEVDFGVMGLEASRVQLIEAYFGTEAIKRIEGDDAEHAINLKGVGSGVKFVPIIVEPPRFLEQVHRHAAKQASKYGNDKMIGLSELTSILITQHEQKFI